MLSTDLKTDCLFAHEVTVRPLENGRFQYVGNKVTYQTEYGFVDMDVYEQEYRFYYFARCPYEKTDTTFRSIPLTTESFPQKEGGEAV